MNKIFLYFGLLVILSPFMSAGEEYESINYVGADGHKIELEDNPDSKNISYSELIKFIKMDETEKKEYLIGNYTCGDYAEELHNNAERAGIKTAWVYIEFEGDINSHACNAFYTTDKGLIFIDCTQYDTKVICEPGEPYHMEGIGKDKEYSFLDMGIVKKIEMNW